MVLEHGEITMMPIEVSHPEWSDPARAFRDLAQFQDTDMMDLWHGLDFTTTDLILDVCENFNDFMSWFEQAMTLGLDKIRETTLLVTDLRRGFKWVDKLDVKVLFL